MVTFCPNCNASLFNPDNYKMIAESKVFGKNNFYAMCIDCGHLFIYNKYRNMLFDLDDYKDDEGIVLELQQLFDEIEKQKEQKVEEPAKSCELNCDECNGCEPVRLKENVLLLVNDDGSADLVSVEELGKYDLSKCQAYSLEPVKIEPVITYKIHKM